MALQDNLVTMPKSILLTNSTHTYTRTHAHVYTEAQQSRNIEIIMKGNDVSFRVKEYLLHEREICKLSCSFNSLVQFQGNQYVLFQTQYITIYFKII